MRVLVCDDAEPVRVSLARALEYGAGADVHTVATAEEAIEAAGQRRVDVIVMDHELPGMLGFDAIGVLRAKGCTKPVILLTGDRGIEGPARRDPSITYLNKQDASIAQIVTAIRAATGKGRSRPSTNS